MQDTARCRILDNLTEAAPEGEWQIFNNELKLVAEENLQQLKKSNPLRLVYLRYLANSINNLGIIYDDKGDLKKAIGYYQQALSIQQEINNPKGIADSYNNLGYICRKMLNVQAIDYYEKALKIYKEQHDKKGTAVVITNIANIYEHDGQIQKAIEKYFEALKIAEEAGDKEKLGVTLNNISGLYLRQSNLELATKYAELTFKAAEQSNNKSLTAQAYNNLALTLLAKKDTLKALDFYQKALITIQGINDVQLESTILSNMAILFLKQGKFDEAIRLNNEAIETSRKGNNEPGIASALRNYSGIYYKTNQLTKALEYGQKSLALWQQLGNVEEIAYAAELMKRIYHQLNQPAKALEMFELHVKMRDSVLNMETRKTAIQKEMQYQFDKRESALKAEQEKAEAIAEEEKEIRRIQIIAFSVLLLFIIIIGFLIFRQNKLKADQQSARLEQKLLRSQMNPHFIFNTLQAIQNFTIRNNGKEATKYLGSFGTLTRSVLENSRVEFITLKKEITLLENYLQLQKLLYGNRFEYEIKIAKEVDAETTMIPPMMSQPFIENAIEHGLRDLEAGGKIEVYFSQTKKNLLLEIKDNGNGLASASTKQHQSLATVITQERINLLNKKGSVNAGFTITEAYPNSVQKGVKVNFVLPLIFA